MKIRACPALIALALMGLAPAAAPADAVVSLDWGHFNVSLNGIPIGTEQFALDVHSDSLVVQGNAFEIMPRREANGAAVTLQKQVGIITGAVDFELRNYLSRQVFRGDTITRGVIPEAGDTLFTVYRERNGAGSADRCVLPPGRMFVIDSPPMFTTFTLICHSLHGKVFERRPIQLMMLGGRDTMLVSTVADLGIETIRWGARPVQARKLEFTNAQMHFFTWSSPDGRMLRAEEPEVGLRAERDAPAVKRRTKRAG